MKVDFPTYLSHVRAEKIRDDKAENLVRAYDSGRKLNTFLLTFGSVSAAGGVSAAFVGNGLLADGLAISAGLSMLAGFTLLRKLSGTEQSLKDQYEQWMSDNPGKIFAK